MKKPWFKAKTYGWGWYPSTWQGWLILLAYIGLLYFPFFYMYSKSKPINEILINFIPRITILTLLLIIICLRTGEKPRWQWGEKNHKKNSMTL